MLSDGSALLKLNYLFVMLGEEGRSSCWVPVQDKDKQARSWLEH